MAAMSDRSMTVTVTLRVEVDVKAWRLEYDIERTELRQDVKLHVLTTVQGQLANLALGSAELVR